MDNNYPTITIGCPVRDRAIYLPHYLKCISNLNYPKSNINLIFVENDSTDNSLEILENFKLENNKFYNRIDIPILNQNTPKDTRIIINTPEEQHEDVREKYIYKALSNLRNFILDQVETDYLLSCDSDIMMTPDTLYQLLYYHVDFISALVVNGYHKIEMIEKLTSNGYFVDASSYNVYHDLNILKLNSEGQYCKCWPTSDDAKIAKVDLSGACMLLSNKACKIGRFNYSPDGEDAPFCKSLQDNGINIYCNLACKLPHCMNETKLKEWIEGTFVF